MAESRGALTQHQWQREREMLLHTHGEYAGLTTVIVQRTFPSSADMTQWQQEVGEWLSCPDRPGGWDALSARLGTRPCHGEVRFWFTDPDLAFEFKMTWG